MRKKKLKKRRIRRRTVEVYPTFTETYESGRLKKRRGIGGVLDF